MKNQKPSLDTDQTYRGA